MSCTSDDGKILVGEEKESARKRVRKRAKMKNKLETKRDGEDRLEECAENEKK